MKINSTQLLGAYEQARAYAASDVETASAFTPVELIFEDKKQKPDACVMVYGVYNAGKSTLINVLLGREEAAVDDIPKTDQVTAYVWDKYTILDTPGVDAPIDHENVTKAQMLKADAIIFVVDPLGTVEEAKTLEVLVDLLAEHKQVFMVFNDKKGLSDEDFIKLKDQTRDQLQQIATVRGMGNILKDVPIVRVNARRALNGQLKGKPELVELSGYPAFRSQLVEFLDGISPDAVYERLKHELVEFLNARVNGFGSRQDHTEISKKFDKFLRQLAREKSGLSSDMDREIERERQEIYQKIKRAMRTSPEDCQRKIEDILQQASELMQRHLSRRLQEVVAVAQQDIEELQAAMPQVGTYTGTGGIPSPDGASAPPPPQAADSSGVSAETAAKTAQQVASMVKPEHIVSTLKTVKDLLPSLMKGIGPKTMEKWAGTLAGKYIPYVGIVVTAVMALRDLFSDDPEEKAMREHAEQQRLARERAEQQMDDFSQELADGFRQFMRDNVLKEVDGFFAQLNAQVDKLREGFSDTERQASERLQKWVAIQQLALSA
jgi:GTP1/Obg family GTP-binding protein